MDLVVKHIRAFVVDKAGNYLDRKNGIKYNFLKIVRAKE